MTIHQDSKKTLMALSISHTSITYIQQLVVPLYGMIIYEEWSPTDHMFKEIINQTKQPTAKQSIYYSGKNVGVYVNSVYLCYLLLQQRKYLSRGLIQYKFISTKDVSDTEHIVLILNDSRSMDGLYKNASLFQKREVHRWFGENDKVHMCFRPTSKEYETAKIGCLVVFFEIL